MILNQAFKGLNDWWRYLLGILIVIAAYGIGQIPLTILLFTTIGSNQDIGVDELETFNKSMDFTLLGIDKNLGFALLIMIFIFALAGLWLTVKYLHHKKIIDLITPNRPIDFKRILLGFGIWFLLGGMIELVSYFIAPEDYHFRWSGSSFFVLVLISLFLLPFQTAFEELFFRGYIMQGIVGMGYRKWVAILGSSILFGLIHSMNPEISKYGFLTMQVYYILAGVFLALVTVLDDSLELAIGIHTAINFIGATMITYEGSVLQTDTLFVAKETNPWLMIAGLIVSGGLFIAICTRLFGWKPLSSTLDDSDLQTNASPIKLSIEDDFENKNEF